MTVKDVNAESAFKPELWSTKLNMEVADGSVMAKCVNRDYEGEIKEKGDKVHIFTPQDVTISDYTMSGTLTYQDPEADDQQLEINQKKTFSFYVNDITKAQANIKNIGAKYLEKAKQALIDTQDTFLLGKSSDVYSGNQVGEVALTKDNVYANFVKMAMAMATNKGITNTFKCVDGSNLWAVVDPDTYGLILQADQVVKLEKIGTDAVARGVVAQLAGFDIYVSANVTGTTTGTTKKTTILSGAKNAITFAQQVTEIKTTRDKDNPFVDYIAGLYLYGAKTVNPKALASIVKTETVTPTT